MFLGSMSSSSTSVGPSSRDISRRGSLSAIVCCYGHWGGLSGGSLRPSPGASVRNPRLASGGRSRHSLFRYAWPIGDISYPHLSVRNPFRGHSLGLGDLLPEWAKTPPAMQTPRNDIGPAVSMSGSTRRSPTHELIDSRCTAAVFRVLLSIEP